MLRYGNLGRLIVSTAACLQARAFAVDVLLLYNRNRAGLLGLDASTLPPVHPLLADARQQAVRAWQTMDNGPLSLGPLLSIWRTASHQRYDVLHTHDLKSNVFGLLVARLKGIPVVATAHGYPRAILRNEVYRRLDLLALRLCRHVVCVSAGLRAELAASGLDERRMTVVHNGIDVAEVERAAGSVEHRLRADLGLAADAPIIMAVGRMSAEKGHVHLLRAARQVLALAPRAHIVIVGDGPLRHDLEAEAHRLGVAEHVSFLGFRVGAAGLMAQSNVLVNPSLGEALGNALLEGMALGKPVIGTSAGGMPEVIVDGECGLIVPPGNPEALAAAILRLLADPDAAQDMGRRARQRVLETFTVERMAEGLATVFLACRSSARD